VPQARSLECSPLSIQELHAGCDPGVKSLGFQAETLSPARLACVCSQMRLNWQLSYLSDPSFSPAHCASPPEDISMSERDVTPAVGRPSARQPRPRGGAHGSSLGASAVWHGRVSMTPNEADHRERPATNRSARLKSAWHAMPNEREPWASSLCSAGRGTERAHAAPNKRTHQSSQYQRFSGSQP
jgi:hypothetical protein